MKHVIPILGMHRSGTSLSARQLQEAGLFIGNDLLGGDISNPAGHFENREFLQLQKDILAFNNSKGIISKIPEWKFEKSHHDRAEALVSAHRGYQLWGWKDPRTSILMEFWKPHLAGLKCIPVIVLRDVISVANSLLARTYYSKMRKTRIHKRLWMQIQMPYKPREFSQLTEQYALTWLVYYSAIKKDVIDAEMPFFVVEYATLQSGRWIGKFSKQFGLELGSAGDYDPARSQLSSPVKGISIPGPLLNQAETLYSEILTSTSGP